MPSYYYKCAILTEFNLWMIWYLAPETLVTNMFLLWKYPVITQCRYLRSEGTRGARCEPVRVCKNCTLKYPGYKCIWSQIRNTPGSWEHIFGKFLCLFCRIINFILMWQPYASWTFKPSEEKHRSTVEVVFWGNFFSVEEQDFFWETQHQAIIFTKVVKL